MPYTLLGWLSACSSNLQNTAFSLGHSYLKLRDETREVIADLLSSDAQHAVAYEATCIWRK